ncbi:MAG: AAA family ATPase, partial [Pseudomonadota bacterium]
MRRIRRITLQHFRTYGFLDFSLPGKSVALTGANGVGKTNLIEALSLMSPGRGMRRAKLDEIAQQGSSGDWGIGLSLKEDDDAEAVQLALQIRHDAPTKKLCRVNGDPVPTIGRFAEYIRFTWLTPAQDRLFMEGAAERRRFLDRMVLAQNTAHAQVSSAYEKAMRQRQAILADPSGQDPQLLDVLEGQMAQNAVAIAVGRTHMADILREGYKALHEG